MVLFQHIKKTACRFARGVLHKRKPPIFVRPGRGRHTTDLLVSTEEAAGVVLGLDVVQTGVVAVGDDALAAALELGQVVRTPVPVGWQ